jgi:hypothetical protein
MVYVVLGEIPSLTLGRFPSRIGINNLEIQFFAVLLPTEIRDSSDDNKFKTYNYEKIYYHPRYSNGIHLHRYSFSTAPS